MNEQMTRPHTFHRAAWGIAAVLALIPLVVAVVLIGLTNRGDPAATSAVAPTPTPEPTRTATITGLLRVEPTLVAREVGTSCTTSRGYDDIATGTQVTFTDPAGKVVALGELGPGYVNPVLASD